MAYDETQESAMPAKVRDVFLDYRLAGPSRPSFRKLGEEWEKAGKGKKAARQKQLERWSRAYEWQRLCEEWDRARREERYARWEDSYAKFEADMIAAASGMLGLTLANLRLLIEEDNRRLTDYDAQRKAWKPGKKQPKRPVVAVGPYILASLFQQSTQEARQAHLARLNLHAEDAPAPEGVTIPGVFEVYLTSAPPPEPRDPLEDRTVPEFPPGAAARPAMIGLTNQPPPDEDDLEDDED